MGETKGSSVGEPKEISFGGLKEPWFHFQK